MDQYFVYRARTVQNGLVTGRVQAPSLEAAKKILIQNKLTPLSLSTPRSVADFFPFFKRVTLKEKTLFARQLATMIEAGLTLAQALRLLVKQSKENKFQGILAAILSDVQDGFSFSAALAKFPDTFDNIFINVVRAGEATGKLETVLSQLAATLEKDVAIRGKIRGALFYPCFIIAAMIGVGILMTTTVIPQLKDVFTSSNQQLPSSTTLLLAISDFLINKWPIALLGTVGTTLAIRYFFRSETGIRLFSRYSLKLPVAGGIITQSSMARFGRLLGMLLSSGVPLLEGLRMIQSSFPNRLHQRGIAEIITQVERGIPMSVPIADNPVFPLLVAQMVAVGEQTGKMDEVMTKMAAYYDSEVDTLVSGMTSLIEPMVIVLLGIAVAWLVQAILLPIYQISSSGG